MVHIHSQRHFPLNSAFLDGRCDAVVQACSFLTHALSHSPTLIQKSLKPTTVPWARQILATAFKQSAWAAGERRTELATAAGLTPHQVQAALTPHHFVHAGYEGLGSSGCEDDHTTQCDTTHNSTQLQHQLSSIPQNPELADDACVVRNAERSAAPPLAPQVKVWFQNCRQRHNITRKGEAAAGKVSAERR